jgi:SNF2 family DNA or RNA helicase
MSKLISNPNLNTNSIHSAFKYQSDAVDAIKDLDYSAVFHEQGLGKTKIAFDAILYWLDRKYVDSVIIVTKRSLVANWEKETKFHTHIIPQVLSQDRNRNYYLLNSPSKLYIAHYEALRSEQERMKLFFKTRDLGMVLDESQKIKNPNSSISGVFHTFTDKLYKKMILTGTPITNRPYDIWSQIYFLDRGESLGNDFEAFKQNMDLTSTLETDEAERSEFEHELTLLWSKIRKFSVRETKSGAGIDLPQKHIEIVATKWEDEQQCMYNRIRDEMKLTIIQDGVPIEDDSEGILKRLLRLIQVTSNPATIDDSYTGIPGKFNFLLELVSKIRSKHEKVIIWTSFIKNANWLKRNLANYSSVIVHGGLSIDIRNKNLNRFMTDDEIGILIATPGAAKEGLTLTAANHVIFYDRTFSLDDYLQAQDRIHRISQTKECFVYNLIMESSIDEWVNLLLKAKALAASLGQGDIDYDYYSERIEYNFTEILNNILENKRPGQ